MALIFTMSLDESEDIIKTNLRKKYTKITNLPCFQLELSCNPQDLLQHPDVFQEIWNKTDPIKNLLLQDYLQTVMKKMNKLQEITEATLLEIILSSNPENSCRKRGRPSPTFNIYKLDRSSLLQYMFVWPPMHVNGHPYTVNEMNKLSLKEIRKYILTAHPDKFI